MKTEDIDIFGLVERVSNKYDLEIYVIRDFLIANANEKVKVVEGLSGDYSGTVIPMVDNKELDDASKQFCVFRMDLDEEDEKMPFAELLNKFRVEFVNSYIACSFNDDNLVEMYFVQCLGENNIKVEEIKVEEEFENKLDVVFKSDEFDINEISSKVKEAIINQDHVVDKALTNIIFNQKIYYSNFPIEKARFLKKNMLIFGKTGTGKTEIIKQIVENLDCNIPCIVEDANGYTIDGYKGKDVINMLRRLVVEADYDLEAAEHGILIIDEIDKKLPHNDVSEIASTGVQKALLKIIEGDVFDLTDDKMPEFSGMEINTSLITVVLLGHFENVYRENRKRAIGFEANGNDGNHENVYKPEDFIRIGMIPEFMGRITDIVKTNDLTLEDLKNITTKSIISPLVLQKEFYEDQLGIKLEFDDEFINALAARAEKLGTGARGIKSVYSEMFDVDNLEFELLSGDIEKVSFQKGKVRKYKKREGKSCAKKDR